MSLVLQRLLVTAILLCAPLTGHDFSFTQALVVFDADGGYRIDMSIDVDALALGLPLDADSALVSGRMEALDPTALKQAVERAREAVRQRVRVLFDGEAQTPEIAFPNRGAAPEPDAPPSVLGTVAQLSGQAPADARDFFLGADEGLKNIHLTIFDARGNETRIVTPAGQTSEPYPLRAEAAARSRGVFAQYTSLGFEHILPKGLDHILFVIGLFLTSARLRPLLIQVTSFTVAHSISLALSTLGVVALPSRFVETMIAVSIAWIAAENLLSDRVARWRPALVFAFGLLHGLGFAGVLGELGLPQGEFLTALFSFNLGVELGQLAVIGLALITLGRFSSQSWYRKAVVMPASAAIGLAGLYWAFERALG